MGTRALILVVLSILTGAAAPAAADPALVAYGDGGIRVEDELAVSGKVDGAAIDSYRDRLWYVQKKTLYVMDLTADDWKPVAIAKNMPPGGWMMDAVGFRLSEASVFPILDIDGTIEAANGPAAGMDRKADKRARAAIKKIKIVGKKWLKKHKNDPGGKDVYRSPTTNYWHATHEPLNGAEACEGYLECGQAQELPRYKNIWMEVVANRCVGNDCHAECLIHAADGTWATPNATSAWSKQAPSVTGPCFDYLWLRNDTFAVGEARCSVNTDGVTCGSDPGWIAAGWVNWPPGVVPSLPERQGIDMIRLATVDGSDPHKGLPAGSDDSAEVILPVRTRNDSGVDVYAIDWCKGGSVECRRDNPGHDDDSRVMFEIRTEAAFKETGYAPLPSWNVDDDDKLLKTDWAVFEFARTKKAVTITVTSWDDVELGKATFATSSLIMLRGVAVAAGPTPYVYVRFGVSKTKNGMPDDRWEVFPLTLPPESPE